ncbi:YdeI family protein [Promicromonospora sp. Populi]|uniref:YdeI/OmpD-associated family protein n=1 Tax=Promicromonospora sp. Populi TaxID=3239420 RepID=UPI0034E2C9E1
MADTDPELLITDAAAWRAWLDEHEAMSDGVWLILARKGKAGPTSLTRDEALDEALCSGWIDAQARGRDDSTSLQRFCPRRSRSRWSARNVRIVDRLITEGRMRARGQEEIDKAKADGRWEVAYEGSKNFEVPPDLTEALAASPRAAAMFEILTAQNRFAILFRITAVKKPETRARNVAKFVGMLERGETVHPQKRKLDGQGD